MKIKHILNILLMPIITMFMFMIWFVVFLVAHKDANRVYELVIVDLFGLIVGVSFAVWFLIMWMVRK